MKRTNPEGKATRTREKNELMVVYRVGEAQGITQQTENVFKMKEELWNITGSLIDMNLQMEGRSK